MFKILSQRSKRPLSYERSQYIQCQSGSGRHHDEYRQQRH